MEMAGHSRPDAIALFRLAGHADKACRAFLFLHLRRRRQAEGDGTDHPGSQPAGSVKGSACPSWPRTGGIGDLHHIGGRGTTSSRDLGSRGLAIARHFHGVPILSVPLVTLAASFQGSRTAACLSPWTGIGWMEGSEPG